MHELALATAFKTEEALGFKPNVNPQAPVNIKRCSTKSGSDEGFDKQPHEGTTTVPRINIVVSVP